MADKSADQKDTAAEVPAPEVLKPRTETAERPASEVSSTTPVVASSKHTHRGTYRPSHKATFIGLAVVVLILAINAGVVGFIIKSQSKSKSATSPDSVTISPSALGKLGVNRSTVGDAGMQLEVGPNSKFDGTVSVGGDISIGGQLKLNSKFSASDASLAQLEAGNTSLTQLNVNGDATASTLNLRKDLNVAGLTRLQGPVTMTQLLSVNNSVNITGSLSVGGSLLVNNFHASTLIVDSTVMIGGHIITRGSAPSAGPGNALGSNGTMSISGNDIAGTVAANIGTNAGSGIIANVAFRNQYSSLPHVVVTAVGGGVGSVYVNRTVSGFSIGVNGPLAPGGYAFDYIVMQ